MKDGRFPHVCVSSSQWDFPLTNIPRMPCRGLRHSSVHKSRKLPSLYAHEADRVRRIDRSVKGRRPITNKLTYFSWINRHQGPSNKKDVLNIVLEKDGEDQLDRSREKRRSIA